MHDDNKKDDLFEQAFNESVKNTFVQNINEEEISLDVINKQIAIDSTEGSFKDIESYIKGAGAKRFVEVLSASSDKDFLRFYPKMLEYFKPKINRVDEEDEEIEDNTLNINIMYIDNNGEIKKMILDEN